jgi:hypothetical protein
VVLHDNDLALISAQKQSDLGRTLIVEGRSFDSGPSPCPYSPNLVEDEFSEVPLSPGSMQRGFLCRVSEASSPMYIRLRQYLPTVLWPLLG